MERPEKRRSFGETRRRALYSVRALAEEAGVSSRTIMDIEHGRTTPQLGTIRKLSTVLKVDPLQVVEFARAIEGDTEGKDNPAHNLAA